MAIRLGVALLPVVVAAVLAPWAPKPTGAIWLASFVTAGLLAYFFLDRWSFYGVHMKDDLVYFPQRVSGFSASVAQVVDGRLNTAAAVARLRCPLPLVAHAVDAERMRRSTAG